ncbi:MAG: sulfotransferase [Polyangiales bacterium]
MSYLSQWNPFSRASWVSREQEFHEIAIRAAGGCDDFGDPSYLEGLRRLLYSYDHEARLHPAGKLVSAYQTVGLLATRLRLHQWFSMQPDSASNPIERPIIITGMVRTGSTALHYLMGSNPDMQCLQYWLGLHPQPRPPRKYWAAATDFQHARIELDMMYRAGKNMLEAIHHMTAEGPDESGRVLGIGFSDDRFEVVSTVPTYSEWYDSTVHRETYGLHKRTMQLIGSYEADTRWLLKYPVHLRNIDALLETYPDACVIWTHRDPADVLPSYVSLCAHFRSLFEKDPDRPRIALEQMEAWARAVERGMELRKGREHQFHDIYFGDFMEDPIREVEKAYRRFGQPFSEAARVALTQWRDTHQPGQFGTHNYERNDFGQSPATVHARYAGYLDRFPRVLDGKRRAA